VIISVVQQNAEESGWSFCQVENTEDGSVLEGWVPEAALNYNYKNEPLPDKKKDPSNRTRDKSPKIGQLLGIADLPIWARQVKNNCLWWSASQDKYMDVFITDIDIKKQMVYITFKVNKASWKAVKFHDLIGRRAAKCPLQPPAEEEEVRVLKFKRSKYFE
jgi:hypothetical protein